MAQLLETNGTSIRTSNNNMDYVKLYNQSENELINEVMPFWLNFGIDEQYGGFICGLKHNGDIDDDSNVVTTAQNKFIVHSYLRKNFFFNYYIGTQDTWIS